MWLLDENLPVQLKELLAEYGIASDLVSARGWKGLKNGTLVKAAAAAGFVCVLTRDKLFGQDAAKALRDYPAFAVVLITLPQLKAHLFIDQFRLQWQKSNIVPAPGAMTRWPP